MYPLGAHRIRTEDVHTHRPLTTGTHPATRQSHIKTEQSQIKTPAFDVTAQACPTTHNTDQLTHVWKCGLGIDSMHTRWNMHDNTSGNHRAEHIKGTLIN